MPLHRALIHERMRIILAYKSKNQATRMKNAHKITPRSQNAPPHRTPWLWVGLVALGAFVLVIVGFTLLRDGSDGSTSGGKLGPVVAVEQEVFDYGNVKVNTPIETLFRVSNAGDEPLKIAGDPEVELVEGC